MRGCCDALKIYLHSLIILLVGMGLQRCPGADGAGLYTWTDSVVDEKPDGTLVVRVSPRGQLVLVNPEKTTYEVIYNRLGDVTRNL